MGRSFPDLVDLLQSHVEQWIGEGDTCATAHFLAHTRLKDLMDQNKRPTMLLTSVTRVVEQKLRLMLEAGTHGTSGLEGILELLGNQGLYILLGTGDPRYEQTFTTIASRYQNFVFLNGFSAECADALYAAGDLFLMPSSYEPCRISQMEAMKHGQPCLVHKVGGLKDTIKDGRNGFCFAGETVKAQVDHLVKTCRKAIKVKQSNPATWRQIRKEAAASRFLWKDSVEQYLAKLYKPPPQCPNPRNSKRELRRIFG